MRRTAAFLCALAVACTEPEAVHSDPAPDPATMRPAAHVVIHVGDQAETSGDTQHAERVVALFESAQDRQRRLVSASDWDTARRSATFALELTFDDS